LAVESDYVLAVKAVGLTWNSFTIALAALVGCMVLGIVVFVAAMVSVPALMLFRACSVHFCCPPHPVFS
jgi:hypothetical protein